MHEPLARVRAEQRARHVALGKLLGRNLREAGGVHHFETHRAIVHHAVVTGEARGVVGRQAHRLERRRERRERHLHLHLHGEEILLRLIELHDEAAEI